jgi:predicted metalloprotease
MRLDNEAESPNIQDDRGNSGGMGSPFGGNSSGFGGSGGGGGGLGGMLIPLLINTIGFRGIIILAVIYFALKMTTGIDLMNMVNGGGGGVVMPQTTSVVQPSHTTTQLGSTAAGTAASDPGKQFVAKVLNSTDQVWTKEFADMGKQYVKPTLVLFSNFDQSACGTAQSASGPFYCPADSKVYIDLAFYQELKNKLGAPGDFAQAYVIAHEVGHHVQHLLGITDQVDAQTARASKVDANRLSVRVELQADCFAGIWAQEAGVASKVQIESGDIEQALNAASQIGDDHLQKAAQGYAVPDSFTHGTSAERVKWFKMGTTAQSINDCNTFNTSNLG